MHNLHGGTVIGYATTMVLTGTALLSFNLGTTLLGLLFFVVMILSSLLALGTLVRFFRNHNRYTTSVSVSEAREEWFRAIAHTNKQRTQQ
jgi:hypothetical protein